MKICTYCKDHFISEYESNLFFRMSVCLSGFTNYNLGPDDEDICDECSSYISYESYICKYCEVEFIHSSELILHISLMHNK